MLRYSTPGALVYHSESGSQILWKSFDIHFKGSWTDIQVISFWQVYIFLTIPVAMEAIQSTIFIKIYEEKSVIAIFHKL